MAFESDSNFFPGVFLQSVDIGDIHVQELLLAHQVFCMGLSVRLLTVWKICLHGGAWKPKMTGDKPSLSQAFIT